MSKQGCSVCCTRAPSGGQKWGEISCTIFCQAGYMDPVPVLKKKCPSKRHYEMTRCQSCVQLVYGELNWNRLIECPFWVFFCHYVLTSSSSPDLQQTHAHMSRRFRWHSCYMLWLYITLSSPSFPHRYEICNLNFLFCNQLSKWLIQLCTTSFHSFFHSYILCWFINYCYFKERNKLFPIWIGEPGTEQKLS